MEDFAKHVAPFDLDLEHGHRLSSTRYENVIVAIKPQRLAVLTQLDKRGVQAARETEFPALTVRRNPKNVVEENRHLDEVCAPRLVVLRVYRFLHLPPFKET
jgi:hypothetical protein